ncbi:hypothetical protein VP1G_10871 [Cytospora mali]|uniref:Uncharacterized protein n=1 Tax=Cytospora mali TaxID=578113 RepID=A0A194UYA5_CYTMA|nr:hypothetical protein VP1G_10871 [Valsa mali var. pyri (nom. inval.)]
MPATCARNAVNECSFDARSREPFLGQATRVRECAVEDPKRKRPGVWRVAAKREQADLHEAGVTPSSRYRIYVGKMPEGTTETRRRDTALERQN